MKKKKLIIIISFIVIAVAMIVTTCISNNRLHIIKSSQINDKILADTNKTYTITYNANGGTGGPQYITANTASGPISISTLEPTREGYIFKGWSTDPYATTAEYQAGVKYSFEEDTTLYAVWAKIYTITYDANGGTGGPQYITTNTASGPISISTLEPTREGYNFKGWSTDPNAITAEYKPGVKYSFEDDTTLYAVWAKTYTITYNANGGTGGPQYITTNTASGPISISTLEPTRAGYIFKGWSTDQYAITAEYQPGVKYSFEDDTTLYAVWEKILATYTITYNANGGTGAPSNQTKTEGQAVNLSSTIPTREGYKFLGWSKSNSATSATYTANATFTDDANTTLYAVWEKDKTEEDKTEEDKTEEDKTEEDKTEEDKTEEDKTEGDKTEEDKTEEDKKEEDKTEEDKTEEDKKEDVTIDKNIISVTPQDNTKANTTLPKTGINPLKIITILVIAMCTFFGIKYKTTRLS